ncbi:hypothetical protein [Bradyrhizobium sp. BR 1433]|uniref:hypothetical protein n=1 Tax=Bradyrhizobium sp. BR 1433 TaxID=3447967 RepID=UPI003EE44031
MPAAAINESYSVATHSLDRGRRLRVVANSDVKAEIRSTQRAWLRRVLEKTGKSASELAVNSGMADVTLTRFLNREDYEGTLSALNIEKIKRYSQCPGPNDEWPEEKKGGFAEASSFNPTPSTAFSAMVAAAVAGRPNATPWLLETDALESLHFLRGDVLITDASAHAVAGDLVVAQSINPRTGDVESIFRILEPPYLIGVGNDPVTRKPLLIDNSSVIVVGVVTESLRARQR